MKSIALLALLGTSIDAKATYTQKKPSYSYSSYSSYKPSTYTYSYTYTTPSTYYSPSTYSYYYAPSYYSGYSYYYNPGESAPTVTIDETVIDSIGADFESWSQRVAAAKNADSAATVNDMSHAFSKYLVSRDLAFGKNFGPLVSTAGEFIESLNVDMTICKADVATDCVQTWMLTGANHDRIMETCIANAGCVTDFEKLT